MRNKKTAATRPAKKTPARPATKPPGDLPPASAEALEIDQAAAASRADMSGEPPATAPGPAAPDLGAELGKRDEIAQRQITAAETQQMQAEGTAQLLMLLGTKVAAKRWPGVTFEADEMSGGVEVLAPVLIKYDLGSKIFDEYKELFAAGAFFAGLITAKSQQYEAAQLKKKEKAESASGAEVA